jgi:hypothetical protein
VAVKATGLDAFRLLMTVVPAVNFLGKPALLVGGCGPTLCLFDIRKSEQENGLHQVHLFHFSKQKPLSLQISVSWPAAGLLQSEASTI